MVNKNCSKKTGWILFMISSLFRVVIFNIKDIKFSIKT